MSTRQVFYGEFNNLEKVKEEFRLNEEQKKRLDAATVILASYEYESYSGYAYVLFREGDQLFEVVGSHCSCYGLEDDWNPEATTYEALAIRSKPYGVGEEQWTELMKYIRRARRSWRKTKRLEKAA